MKKKTSTALSLAIAGLISAGSAQAAFQIKQEKKEPVKADTITASVFDQSEYSVWVDNTYKAVHEYGKRDFSEAAPSYGDPMPLSDALRIVVPNSWKVLRAKNLEQDGKLLVSWDMESTTWVGVLKNIGERHGLQFHVDHNRNEVFVKDGRRMIFERPIKYGIEEQYPRAGTERVGKHSQTTMKSGGKQRSRSKVSINPYAENGVESSFTIYKGDAAEGVMKDLALIFGYETTHWLIEDQTVHKTQTYTGDSMHIMSEIAKQFDGRMCLYETDMTAAVIPKTMECPQ
ncbi:MAG: hypothetical protein AWU57_524 [Marinobacter sp. T13-3]|nr:MAG: hypothetical protein AWU57_524 [Marinobacter sp. T13-3]